MNESTEDAGLIAVLLERLEKQRLPRLLALLEKLEGGEPLDHFDLEYLDDVIEDAGNVTPIIDRHPEYHALWAQVLGLYKEIADLALEIEETASN